MDRKKIYMGIDGFRWIAALFIIAIHTSPLSSYWETGDFILTRVIARVGVPFFLMTSGFFLISQYEMNVTSLKKFLKKTAQIYGCSILLYLPLNVYNGYFSMDPLLPNMIRDLVFDGTMYHLWYLPASMAGMVIAWYLVNRTGIYRALAISAVLYGIGLFGDSYYGLVEYVPGIRQFYEMLFQLFDYTRNGIFFAPVFFVMGGLLSSRKVRFRAKECLVGLLISFGLMFAEAMTLHYFQLQRHDSMYLFLLPVMFFLFQILLFYKGKGVSHRNRKKTHCLREATLLIYMIHPMMIVAVRLFAKLTGLERYLVENSLLHFLSVSLASVVFSLFAVQIRQKMKKLRKSDKEESGETRTQRAWLEINIKNLEHNVRELRNIMPKNCRLMAVVKAEAYGHSAADICLCLNQMGVYAFAAATIEEGIELRKKGVLGEILILGYTSAKRAEELERFDLIQTIVDYEHALLFYERKRPLKVHLKIDTGMHRLGIDCKDGETVRKIYAMKNLKICGWYTHLCCSDSQSPEDIAFTRHQIDAFYRLTEEMRSEGIPIPKLHIQSSYGLLNYPELSCDYVRIGIALYGVLSTNKKDTVQSPALRPVLSLKTRVVLIREIRKGETVGYGRDFIAKRDSRIAVLSVGYADGYPRSLSNGLGYALIRGKKAAVVGRICMDQLAVDITEIREVKTGDVATLIGEGENGCPASEAAVEAGTISNELLSRMGCRLPRIVMWGDQTAVTKDPLGSGSAAH